MADVMENTAGLEKDFLSHLWPPFTQMQGLAPVIMDHAEGAVVYDTNGNEYIDAFASLWTVNVGHGRTEIYDAIKAQMEKLAIYHIFQIANEPTIKLAAKVAALMPGELEPRVLHAGRGRVRGDGREDGAPVPPQPGQGHQVHGALPRPLLPRHDDDLDERPGAPVNRNKFEPLLPGFIKLGAPYCYRCAWNKTYGEDCKMECARVVEQEIAFYGPENVGTMLGETMIGTGGVIPPVAEYWPMVCETCKANDVLVINDEVITGFGRSGTWFGFQQFGSDPDLITLAKGLSSGYLPLGAVGAKDHVYDAFLGGPGEAFMSGATYNGHPLCSAAGLANLAIIEREKLVERCAEVGPYLQEGLKTLLKHPIVGDVRGVGLVAGIEYVQDKATREWFPRSVGAAAKIRDEAFKRGVFVRLLGGGHVHAVAPPFIITHEQIDTVVSVLDESIGVVEKQLGY